MSRWLLERILLVVLSTIAAVTIVFWLNFLVPADAATATLSQSGASQDVIQRRRVELGLDRPPLEQYISYMRGLAKLDLGRSWVTGQSVKVLLVSQLKPTVSLAVASIVIALVLGVTGGVLSFAHGWVDRTLNIFSALSVSLPLIFSGSLAIWFFAIWLDWLPATGQGRAAQLVLPAMILGANGAGSIYRVTRDALAETLPAQWVVAARARGFSRVRVWVRYVLRPSVLPILNLIGLQFGYLLGGVAVVETLFARTGLGRVLVSGVLNKDLPVVLSVVLIAALGYGIINLVVDGLHLSLDPRLRSNLHA